MSHIIKNNDFKIVKQGNKYSFSGDMMAPEYPGITGFLDNTFKEIKEENIVFDFKGLFFLNTPGIITLSHSITKLPGSRKVQIEINTDISWHKICVEGLQMICPGKIEIVD